MEKISEYTILEKLDESGKSLVFRARRESNRETVIIKLLKMDRATPTDIARFRHEYAVIKEIDLPGVVRTHGIIQQENDIAIVMEDFDGVALKNIIRNEHINLELFLKIAVAIAEILGQLHRRRIIHGDIKPGNIIVNRAKGIVKLTDFGIARSITHEDDNLHDPSVIENNLAYLSPEQTGRMNRAVDYRTDLYSFGITLYEMLTGITPFRSSDPMELIHSHIARVPVPPDKLSQAVPPVISRIVMKLLAKSADERYQNTYMLHADLLECQKRLNSEGNIQDFEIAENDIAVSFNLPQLLVGREEQIDDIAASFERVFAGAREAIMVIGPPGIGKSALINELHRQAFFSQGYFIAGKFDQYRHEVPYSAIGQAFGGLAARILAGPRDTVLAWRDRLKEALGQNCRLMTEIIPDLEFVTGTPEPIPALPPAEAQNRLAYAFSKFAMCFAGNRSPLVLFLDDLQWADPASLHLLKSLVISAETHHLMIIGSYRDTEVDQAHYLLNALDDLRNVIPVRTIPLPPLLPGHVNQILSLQLRTDRDRTRPLSDLIHAKTGGNPFFLLQFIKTLYENNIIQLGLDYAGKPSWEWNIDTIRTLRVTDNVVELMSVRIALLPEDTQEVMKLASCIGNRFDLDNLARMYGGSLEETLSSLAPALEENLVISAGDRYQFYHDKIQEAVYSHIPEPERHLLHYRIGTLLLRQAGAEDAGERIFGILDQLNHGMSLPLEREERYRLAGLNCSAGLRAKSSAAYRQAHEYFMNGIRLLGPECWERRHELSLELHAQAAESAYLNADYATMETLTGAAVGYAGTPLEQARLLEIVVHANLARNNFPGAIAVCNRILALLGISLPKKPNALTALFHLQKLRLSMTGATVRRIARLPAVTDPRILTAMRVLIHVAISAYVSSPALFIAAISRIITLSLRYGNGEFSTYAYAVYGTILCGKLGDIDRGRLIGDAAVALSGQFRGSRYTTMLIFIDNFFLRHWKEHIAATISPLKEGCLIGLEMGNLEYYAYLVNSYTVHLFYSGIGLGELDREIDKYAARAKNLKISIPVCRMIRQFSGMLQIRSDNPPTLSGDLYDEKTELPDHFESGYRTAACYLYIIKLHLAVLLRDYPAAVDYAERSIPLLGNVTGQYIRTVQAFYYALALASASRGAAPKRIRTALKKIKTIRDDFTKWARHAPANHRHRLCLIEAEAARITGREQAAMRLYDSSIRAARANGFVQEEAVACEYAALFYHERNFPDISATYMAIALRCYRAWGALGKVRQMENYYREYVHAMPGGDGAAGRHLSGSGITGRPSDVVAPELDLSTVLKASQAISGEINLGRLLEKMLGLTMENAGAQRGALMLETDGRLLIEAEGSVDEGIDVMQSRPLESYLGATEPGDDALYPRRRGTLPVTVINYVNTTGETLVLDNASAAGMFRSDPHVIGTRAKSILCAPIRGKGKTSGIIYLENNLTAGSFTRERLELIAIISAQAAISIENARLVAVEKDKAALDREIEMAEDIQRSLLPRQIPDIEGVRVAYRYVPMMGIGGDFVNIFYREGTDRLGLFVCDVSGHGVPAAMTASIISITLDFFWERLIDTPSLIFNELQKSIRGKMGNNFFTACACAINIPEGVLTVSNAGHPYVVIIRKSGATEMAGKRGRLICDFLELSAHNVKVKLQRGDRIILYTDGIIEAESPSGKMLGGDDGEFCSWLRGISDISPTPEALCKNIYYGVTQFTQKVTMDDDLTVLVCEYTGVTA